LGHKGICGGSWQITKLGAGYSKQKRTRFRNPGVLVSIQFFLKRKIKDARPATIIARFIVLLLFSNTKINVYKNDTPKKHQPAQIP